jgi:hypothetical protein
MFAGDGDNEIVDGFGPGGAGWMEIFDVITPAPPAPPGGRKPVHQAWIRVDWPAYSGEGGVPTITGSTGDTHPAVGDLNGDGKAGDRHGLRARRRRVAAAVSTHDGHDLYVGEGAGALARHH